MEIQISSLIEMEAKHSNGIMEINFNGNQLESANFRPVPKPRKSLIHGKGTANTVIIEIFYSFFFLVQFTLKIFI